MIKVVFLVLIAVLLTYTNGAAQKVEVLDRSSYKIKLKNYIFEFLNSTTDTSILDYVGRYTVSSHKVSHNVELLRSIISWKCWKVGGNCFKVVSYNREPQKISLTLDVYHATDSFLFSNVVPQKNTVYVFGDTRLKGADLKFTLNGKEIILSADTYYKKTLLQGEKLMIQRGPKNDGQIISYSDFLPIFVKLTVAELGGGDYNYNPTQIGVTFHSADIEMVKPNEGYFLSSILTESPN